MIAPILNERTALKLCGWMMWIITVIYVLAALPFLATVFDDLHPVAGLIGFIAYASTWPAWYIGLTVAAAILRTRIEHTSTSTVDDGRIHLID